MTLLRGPFHRWMRAVLDLDPIGLNGGSERFLSDGMIPEGGDVERLTTLLGRPLRSYRELAAEIAGSA